MPPPLPLAGVTEWLGLDWAGPDWTYPSGGAALGWFVLFNAVSIGVTVLAARYVIAHLPADHFVADREPVRRSPGQWLLANAAGLVVLLLGVAFLFSPGQGAFLILIGLVMLDLPKLRRWERKLAASPKVLGTLNWIRSRQGKPPLLAPPPDDRPWLTRRQWLIVLFAIVALTLAIGRWVYLAYR